MGGIKGAFAKIFTNHDELSFRNVRGVLWAAILVFPLSVILGDFRYFDLKIELFSLQSYELMLFPLGLGWLVLFFLPKQSISWALKISACLCAALLPLQFLLTDNVPRLGVFMAFQFFNGICAGAAFYLFCFTLNNVERLFGMIIIQFYYGFYYTVVRAFPLVKDALRSWGGSLVIIVLYLVIVFCCFRKKEHAENCRTENTNNDFSSAVMLVIILDTVYYLIMCMINYIEWADDHINSLAYGIGSFMSIILVIIIHLFVNRSALYSWLLFLVLSLLGLGALIPASNAINLSGSFAYGLGDGVGYIIIYFICGGAIKLSKSLKMFRIYCLVFFIQYCIISGILAKVYEQFQGQSQILAFGIVIILCSVSFVFFPFLQRRLFEAPWTDGLKLADMVEYAPALAETEQLDNKENFGLSIREKDILTLLLSEASRKDIAHTLKISIFTVDTHSRKIYRKLGVQSRLELMSKYGKKER